QFYFCNCMRLYGFFLITKITFFIIIHFLHFSNPILKRLN
ncbi:hypothetical protein EIKCOROL_00331, partial [Eikenella corrodens ATCC 23834]